MPSGKVHAFFGLLISAALLYFYHKEAYSITLPYSDIVSYVLLFLIVLLYSQIPDVDHPMSRSTVYVNFLIIALALIFLYQGKISYVWFCLTPLVLLWGLRIFKLVKHRGFFHSFTGGMMMSLPLVWLINFDFFLFGFACATSHIGLDRVTTYFTDRRKKK